MSVLAVITVVECDGCKRLATMTNDVEYTTYEKTWYVGVNTQLCFVCREGSEERLVKSVVDEQAMDRAINKCIRKYGAAEVTHG